MDGNTSPGNRKMRQSRLPFQPISESPKPAVGPRKRKPSSGNVDEVRTPKVTKIAEVKENVNKVTDTIEILDDSQEVPQPAISAIVIDDEEPDASAEIVIKLPMSGKKKAAQKKKESEHEKKSRRSKSKRKSAHVDDEPMIVEDIPASEDGKTEEKVELDKSENSAPEPMQVDATEEDIPKDEGRI
jgi:hypothetical protein